MRSIKDVEVTTSVDDHETSRSVCGNLFLYFETLDAKIASSLKKIIQNSNFKNGSTLKSRRQGSER